MTLQPLHRRLLRVVFCAALAGVFVLALLPAPDGPQFVSWQDKIEHFAIFAVLTGIGIGAWPPGRRVALMMLAYGAAMEVAQSLTSYRTGDPLDWLSDTLGVALAYGLARRASRRRP